MVGVHAHNEPTTTAATTAIPPVNINIDMGDAFKMTYSTEKNTATKPTIAAEYHPGEGIDVHTPDGQKYNIDPDSLMQALQSAGVLGGNNFYSPAAYNPGMGGTGATLPVGEQNSVFDFANYGGGGRGNLGLGNNYGLGNYGGMGGNSMFAGGGSTNASVVKPDTGCSSSGKVVCNCSGGKDTGATTGFGNPGNSYSSMNSPMNYGGYSPVSFGGYNSPMGGGMTGGDDHGHNFTTGGLGPRNITNNYFGGNGNSFQLANMGGMGGMGGMDHGNMPGMTPGRPYETLGGLNMVHAKSEYTTGDYLRDPDGVFNKLVSGGYGAMKGTSFSVDGDTLNGEVTIDGHPAAYKKLFDEGKAQGKTGLDLERYIAKELTNQNDVDDISEEDYEWAKSLGFEMPTRDHDVHGTSAMAFSLGQGQKASFTGAHQMDDRDSKEYNYTSLTFDEAGNPYLLATRLSNNNSSNDDTGLNDGNTNGHNKDVAFATKIALTQDEFQGLMDKLDNRNLGAINEELNTDGEGFKAALGIVNDRVNIDDNNNEYNLTDTALRNMAALGMNIYA
jgi:hypothetical protein